jgi:glutamyl-tRNA synthetase
MGYLPETMRNYLLRLGWSHGDDEIISTAQAIEWFNLESIGKSAARMDYKKLDNLNGHYIRETADDDWWRKSPPSWRARRRRACCP